jgi:hypothetical protein
MAISANAGDSHKEVFALVPSQSLGCGEND